MISVVDDDRIGGPAPDTDPMACQHLAQLANIRPPSGQLVHREECTLCFDGQDSHTGVDVCLTCFNGACLDSDKRHTHLHYEKTHHPFVLNVKRRLKPNAQRLEDEEPPAKMTKLAIAEEREDDKYEHILTIRCWLCEPAGGKLIPDALQDPKIKTLTDAVMTSLSSARQSEVKAWEEEIEPCEHTLLLHQENAASIPASGLAHCRSCELKENLWLCMTCGSLGCGRKLFGGLGGNGHGLEHYTQTGHPISVKLGTITPEGAADIYCYICDDAKIDPSLSQHLSTFGINLSLQTKTEKSMTELQLEHNLTYDFSLLSSDGQSALEPIFGPGLTGLQNLGNSCYMASVLQVLFAMRPWQERYERRYSKRHEGFCEKIASGKPGECLECQMCKIADGLLSGRYSVPSSRPRPPPPLTSTKSPDSEVVFQDGIRPMTFKSVIGKGHAEFSTMRQQDSEEFFTYLMQTLRRDLHKYKSQGLDIQDPTKIFSYAWEQRIYCSGCTKVKYRYEDSDVLSVAVPAMVKDTTMTGEIEKVVYEDVDLGQCIDDMLSVENLDGYTCPGCKSKGLALKQTKFATFPDTLVIHIKRFQLVNWVPAKLDIPVILPQDDVLTFEERQLGKGIQPEEIEIEDDDENNGPAVPQVNMEILEQLLAMGFSENRCKKALIATGNENADIALVWLLDHSDDPDIDAPIQPSSGGGGGGSGGGGEPDEGMVSMLADMGFTAMQSKKALRETNNDMERAVEWLFNHPDDDGSSSSVPPSNTGAGQQQKQPRKELEGTREIPIQYRLKSFISHKGPSVHSGHYVAHIRKGGGEGDWVLFNDEKVVRADEQSVKELKKSAYLYVFEKV